MFSLIFHLRLRRFTEDHAARQSESNVENINSTNRPSALERNYEQFYDHERMDAVDVIENLRLRQERSKWTELDDKLNACLIFEVNRHGNKLHFVLCSLGHNTSGHDDIGGAHCDIFVYFTWKLQICLQKVIKILIRKNRQEIQCQVRKKKLI